MYIFLKKLPRKEETIVFKMHKSINENYINYKVNYPAFSLEEKEQFIKRYNLKKELLTYKEDVFLSIPVTKVNRNISIKEEKCI